ncbi:MAG: 2-oxoacid:acceptor oxidoreductase subunit alpha [Elusimicrobia bacterium]|nr:2-oxoacid:acceptor oxidoreductase subunit alpha [Elusimicrobiota bacterium]
MKKEIVNDFTIEVATVNGTGSQTSNLVITKAIAHMGIPVGPKNVFPSNIAGLPTWYFIRVNKDGYLGRRREVNVAVLLNPTTFAQDIPRIHPGGAVIYESEYPVTGTAKREDIIYYPVPFGRLASTGISDFKLKKQLTNMLYVGVLAELIGIDAAAITGALRHQLKGKEKAVRVNVDTIEIGRKYARENLKKQDPYALESMNGTKGKVLMEGNTACAMGALFGGCTVAAWYPITPASSLSETTEDLFEKYRKGPDGKKRYAVIQAEDEIAAIGMAIGAGWAGARSMTGTSGPGISLMSEYVGFAYFGEVPVVIFDIQRIGPSTGLPTRTSQGDIFSTATLSHGDTKHVLLIPSTVEECFEFSMLAFDLAERLQTPVFVMSDLDLGMNLWLTDHFKYPTKPFDRGKVLTEEDIKKLGQFERYRDVDEDGITYRTYPGNAHPLAAYFTRGSGHNEAAAYTEDGVAYQRVADRLSKKYETARGFMPESKTDYVSGAKVGIVAYGSTDQIVQESRDILAKSNVKTNYLKLRSIPFQLSPVQEFFDKCDKVYVVEQNRDAQVAQIIKLELGPEAFKKMHSVLHYSGFPIPTESVVEEISGKKKKHPPSQEILAHASMEGGE